MELEGHFQDGFLPSGFGTLVLFGVSVWLDIASPPPRYLTWLGLSIAGLSQDSQVSSWDWLLPEQKLSRASIPRAPGKAGRIRMT